MLQRMKIYYRILVFEVKSGFHQNWRRTLLFGSAFFIIPAIGPLLVAGPFVIALVGALEGAVVVGGLGVIGAALADIGIPKDSILEYETEIKAGKFMLIANGTHVEVQKARETLGI